MPIYEYRCERGHTFEVMQRMADEPVSTCEVCGLAVQRVLHPVAVHFKGSGFYNTDYGTRKRQRETQAAAEGKTSSENGASSEDSSAATKEKEKPSGADKSEKPASSTEKKSAPAPAAETSKKK